MLVVRASQLEALGAVTAARFAEQLRDVVLRTHPRECRQAGGADAMLAWVRLGMKAAASAGYPTRHQVGRWLSSMLILGVDFATDAQLPWVRGYLNPAIDPDPTSRLDRLFEGILDYLGDTAGERAELVVRAMLRARAIDFAALPALEDEAAVADSCARLRAVYPEKYAYQGPELTGENVARQRSLARELGLAGPAGEFLFVLLSFLLGSGFHRDPLHPWARAALAAPATPGAEGDRAARLEAAARAHLASSLDHA